MEKIRTPPPRCPEFGEDFLEVFKSKIPKGSIGFPRAKK